MDNLRQPGFSRLAFLFLNRSQENAGKRPANDVQRAPVLLFDKACPLKKAVIVISSLRRNPRSFFLPPPPSGVKSIDGTRFFRGKIERIQP